MGGFPCPLCVLTLPDDFAEDLEALVGIKDPKADVKECIKDFEARIKL